MRVSWLADAARATGHPVVEVSGWQTRGSTTFNPKGLVWHHTAGAATGDMPTLNTLVNGRAGLPGPLAQYGLGRSGTIYVVAAGRANHAGDGGWKGLVGNASVVGIEAEHVGKSTVPWPAAQLDAYRKLSAEILTRLQVTTEFMCGHKEWAPTRKIDPVSLNMNTERALVAALTQEVEVVTDQDKIDIAKLAADEVLARRFSDPTSSEGTTRTVANFIAQGYGLTLRAVRGAETAATQSTVAATQSTIAASQTTREKLVEAAKYAGAGVAGGGAVAIVDEIGRRLAGG